MKNTSWVLLAALLVSCVDPQTKKVDPSILSEVDDA